MKDITIIIPIHNINEELLEYTKNALNSIEENRKTYDDTLYTMIVCPQHIHEYLKKSLSEYYDIDYIVNTTGKTDFCSQINFAVDYVKTDFFSILEYDDEYKPKWFSMAKKYYYGNEDVSLFLPLNILYSSDNKTYQYGNEMALATSFSNELGFIDFDCLENCFTFNITGGIFNKQDFITMGKLKPSIKVSFAYEFLMRITNKKLKVMVVPKEGYVHIVCRKNSLTDYYNNTISNEDLPKWFDLAKREYPYMEDRNKTIVKNDEKIK